MPRDLKATVAIYKLGEEPKERAYWLTRSIEERIAEVTRLRAMWPGTDQPMQRVVARIRPLQSK